MSKFTVQTLFRPEVLALSAYHVADAQGFIKLDAMENPYTWSNELKQGWLEKLKNCSLNRYPDPEALELTNTLKSLNKIPDGIELLLGNGSDEIIQLLLMALPQNSHVLSTTPSFVMYKQISDYLGLNYHGISLRADLELNVPAMLSAIEQHNPAIIFLAYPNNPTGNLFDKNAINQIIDTANGLVIIDEAYEPFANSSFMNHVKNNVLVMRTFSKLGLAGLRLGYIAGECDIIEQLHKIRLPYNINVLTQASVQFALEHKDVFDEQTSAICAERILMLLALNLLDGITAFESAANFILFKTPDNQATKIFEAIKAQGVLIKNVHPQGGLLANCLRVTVGTPDENLMFLKALKYALDLT
ncbi:histidinol-phosphate aminotransferase 1 [Methylococcaceae bacterium]|nr:histidinol-phosphate aminotransferase 1 [Methylococcaceae bacterium]